MAVGVPAMSAVAFDTLKLARKLRDGAQMSQEQAEGVADALAEAMSGAELATKGDLRELELKIDARFEAVDGRFDAVDARFEALGERIERRAAESEAKIESVKSDLQRWLLLIGVSTILTVLGALSAILVRLSTLPLH
jgi:hypothetical protein